MVQVITATYSDGIFTPDEHLNLLPGTQVRLLVEPLEAASEAAASAWEELNRLCAESSVDSGGHHLTRDQLHERH